MSDQDHDTKWFLAQLKPNAARIAKTNLQRQGFWTFLPTEEQTTQRNSRFVTRQRPLFPGYIFVAFNAAQGLWRKVNATQGVTKLVSFGSAPTPVPDDLVAALQARCNASGQILPAETFEPGEAVALRSGPFADIIAEIEQIDATQRVWVLMDIMGRQTRMAVTPDKLRAV